MKPEVLLRLEQKKKKKKRKSKVANATPEESFRRNPGSYKHFVPSKTVRTAKEQSGIYRRKVQCIVLCFLKIQK